MDIKKSCFGALSDGSTASLYCLDNGQMKVCLTDYGCSLTSILVPDEKKGFTDVLLGHSTLQGYIADTVAHGALIGRFANRIAKGEFVLDGIKYLLDKNDGNNCLHGGFKRYEKQLWQSQSFVNENECGVIFKRTSYDGEQGFPGNVDFTITYSLNKLNEITLDYKAVTDKDTPVNITNHSYFNLKGDGEVTDQMLTLYSDSYLEVNDELIPTGKFIDVKNTPFDFTKEKAIGLDIGKVEPGYDHCFTTKNHNTGKHDLVEFAVLRDPVSGRKLKMKTNQRGVQLYTANYLGGTPGKNGVTYKKHEAVCLESECFPDSINNKEFPSCVLKKGEEYHSVTVYGFEF